MSSLQGFYVSFSGEAQKNPITNVYALSPSGKTVSAQVLDTSQSYQELRGLVFGPDGNLYVSQAYKGASKILQFSGALAPGSSTRALLGAFATPEASAGLLHPYQPAFGVDGNLYVTSQDTNVVTAFYGPRSAQKGQAMANSRFLQSAYPKGPFNAGTFIPAFSADAGVPPFATVPQAQGGLTFTPTKSSTHSVRGLAFDGAGNLYVADEGNDRVAVFDAGGTFLGAITSSKNHSVKEPVALSVDPTVTTLYIGSPGNQRLFTYAFSQLAHGDFQANSLVDDSTRLNKLSAIVVDRDGYIYTASRDTNRIYQWTASGSFQSDVAGPFTDSPEQMIAVYTAITG